jgi:hypothetical protein
VSPVSPSKRHSLSRKPDMRDLRSGSVDTGRATNPPAAIPDARISSDAPRPRIKRTTLEKPLPPAPSDEYANEIETDKLIRHRPVVEDELARQLKGILDLTNTETASIHQRWAPAVTHETVTTEVSEICEEQITREIHNHHVFHRVLPIIDIEVLPARHFVPVEGGYAEISADEVPGRAGENAQWLIAETVSKMLPESRGPIIPERFTARKFEGTDGDYKEYITPEGFKRTEQWWVHPPTFEEGGRETGQTYPFYFGCPDPKDDGLRARLPDGDVIGVSPLFAKQQREGVKAEHDFALPGKQRDPDSPALSHRVIPGDQVDSATSGPVAEGSQRGHHF